MNCQRCGERPGEIRYTEYEGGEARRLTICPECAGELGFGSTSGSDEPESPESAPDPETPAGSAPPPGKGPSGVIDIQVAVTQGLPARPADDRRCPGCGRRMSDLEALLGCPRCYEAFADSLEVLFERVHGARRHRGRLPGGRWIESAAPGGDAPDPPGGEPAA